MPTKKLFSPEWMQAYGELWNSEPATREGTADLSMTICYRLAEDTEQAGMIRVRDGEVVEWGPPLAEHDFLLTAKRDVWQDFGAGKLTAKRAIPMQKLKFQGNMMVALAHIGALEAAMKLIGKVPDTDWGQ